MVVVGDDGGVDQGEDVGVGLAKVSVDAEDGRLDLSNDLTAAEQLLGARNPCGAKKETSVLSALSQSSRQKKASLSRISSEEPLETWIDCLIYSVYLTYPKPKRGHF